jgi:hypothetical protein
MDADNVLPLDGNAAAGLLGELFAFEVTTARLTCDNCGQTGEIATARVYGGAMGAVFRCAHCDGVVMRVTRTPAGYFLDMLGVRQVFVAR